MKAVVFDMDGVIFDTEKAVIEVWQEVAARHNIPNIEHYCRECTGVTAVAARQKFMEIYGDRYSYDDLRAEKTGMVMDRFRNGLIDIKPGVHTILDTLKQNNILIALASSTRRAAVIEELTMTNLIAYFDEIITGDMVANSKPAPDIFLKACAELGVSPEDAVGIEDSYNGVISSHNAGLYTIMVPDILAPTDEMREIADYIAEDLYEALNKIMEKNDNGN